jgi:hypothetical protein
MTVPFFNEEEEDIEEEEENTVEVIDKIIFPSKK